MKVSVPAPRRKGALHLGREGMALPMALMGLLIVSLLVTSALTSGSTESVIGLAHRDATHAIYEADSAIDWYVAQRADQRLDMEVGTFQRTLPSGAQVRFRSAALSNPAAGSDIPKIWHITAEPLTRGGRAVGALVHTQVVTNVPQPLVLDAAATIGQFGSYQPHQARLHGTPTPGMCSDVAPRVALRYPTEKHGSQTWNAPSGWTWPYWADGISRTDATQSAMTSRVTKDTPFSSWITLATFKIGPRFGTAPWKNVPVNAFNAPLGSNPLNWGCPAGMGAGCEGVPGATDFWPVVVIDGEAKTVSMNQGVYGQGVLVVLNGSLQIGPSFRWKGLVLVESSIMIHGDSKDLTPPSIWIEGALVALGNNTTKGVAPRNEMKGYSTSRYNQCAINAAYTGGSKSTPVKPGDFLSYIPYSRFEVIR